MDRIYAGGKTFLKGAAEAFGGAALVVVGGLEIATGADIIPGAGKISLGSFGLTTAVADVSQGVQDIEYGWRGDSTTPNSNFIRDSLFGGNGKQYEIVSTLVDALGVSVGFVNYPMLGATSATALIPGRGMQGNLGTGQVITNKFPGQSQQGRIFNYKIKDGKLIMEQNSIRNMDFVVDFEGKLILGSGHAYLSNGQAVQAAGSLKIDADGYVRGITNWSGHYQPTVAESVNYPKILENAGLSMDKAWIYIDEFTIDPATNYVIYPANRYYNGPVENIPR